MERIRQEAERFLMQSLLCVRQYFRDGNEQEKKLAKKIDQLWKEMEFSWYKPVTYKTVPKIGRAHV